MKIWFFHEVLPFDISTTTKMSWVNKKINETITRKQIIMAWLTIREYMFCENDFIITMDKQFGCDL